MMENEGLTQQYKTDSDIMQVLFPPTQDIPDHMMDLIKEISFVDDAAIAVYGSPGEIADTARALIQNVDNIFLAHGLQFNVQKGKAKILIEFRGRGARRFTWVLTFEGYFDKLALNGEASFRVDKEANNAHNRTMSRPT